MPVIRHKTNIKILKKSMVTYEIKKKGYKYIVVSNLMLIKGDLFTEIFLCWLLSLKKCAKHCPEHLRDLDIDLAHFF